MLKLCKQSYLYYLNSNRSIICLENGINGASVEVVDVSILVGYRIAVIRRLSENTWSNLSWNRDRWRCDMEPVIMIDRL